MKDLRFLHLEDDPLDGELAEMALRSAGIQVRVRRVEDGAGFEAQLREGDYHLILSDYKLPAFDGVHALEMARKIRPDWPFIFVSGTMGEEIAIEALRLGATDYVLKDRISRLAPVVLRALQESAEHRQRAEAEAALRSLLEAARVVKVAPWSVREGRINFSDSIRDILGFDPTEHVRSLEDLEVFLHPEDRTLFRRVATLPSLSDRILESRMRRDDGGWVWTRWTFASDPSSGGVVQDVTEHRRLQDQLAHSQKLDSLGSMAAGIAHDFKNLLQGLGGHAELLGLDDPLTDRQRRSLGAIEQAVARGRALTAKLLAFSRNEPLHKAATNLNTLASEVETLLRPSLNPRTRLLMALEAGLPPTLADPHQLHQVLVNLVLNAEAALEGEGSITLYTGILTLSEAQAFEVLRTPGDYLYFEVEDSGCGIPPEVLPRIFEPFFTTKGAKGTGLGLSVAYGIAKGHGGWIECRSRVGEGTRFRVHLPLVAPPDHERDARREPSGPHKAFRP